MLASRMTRLVCERRVWTAGVSAARPASVPFFDGSTVVATESVPVDTARPVIDDAKEAVLAFIPRRGVDPAREPPHQRTEPRQGARQPGVPEELRQ